MIIVRIKLWEARETMLICLDTGVMFAVLLNKLGSDSTYETHLVLCPLTITATLYGISNVVLPGADLGY